MLVTRLNAYFTAFDRIVLRYGFERLKTVGDGYMCIGGLPPARASHAADAGLICLETLDVIHTLHSQYPDGWDVRIGVHVGPVAAGVVGIDKFAFDVWGTTVNLSSRMESSGAPGRINVSEQVYARINPLFECEARGAIKTKERLVPMFFVNPGPVFSSTIAGSTQRNRRRSLPFGR